MVMTHVQGTPTVLCLYMYLKLVYTYVNVTVFVSGTFDLFNIMCKQHHRTALNPFLNGTKNGDADGICKRSLTLFS